MDLLVPVSQIKLVVNIYYFRHLVMLLFCVIVFINKNESLLVGPTMISEYTFTCKLQTCDEFTKKFS